MEKQAKSRPVRHTVLSPERVKVLREELGLTQVELSRHLGLADVAVRRYESASGDDPAFPCRTATRLLFTYNALTALFDLLNNHLIDTENSHLITNTTENVLRKALQIIREVLP